jgi:hypothetical protein
MSRRNPPSINDTQQNWTLHLNRTQIVMIDMLLQTADAELLAHSGESGMIPAAQRIVQRQIRDLRGKWLS